MVKSPEVLYAIQNYFVKEYYKNSSNKNCQKSGLLKAKPEDTVWDFGQFGWPWKEESAYYKNYYDNFKVPTVKEYADAVAAKMKKDSDEVKPAKTASDGAKATMDSAKKYGGQALVAIATAIKKGDWSDEAVAALVQKIGVLAFDVSLTAMGLGWLAETANSITDLWLKPATIPQLTAADIINAVGNALTADQVNQIINTVKDIKSQIQNMLNDWQIQLNIANSGCDLKDEDGIDKIITCMKEKYFDPSMILSSTKLGSCGTNVNCSNSKRLYLDYKLDDSILSNLAFNTVAGSTILENLKDISDKTKNIETTIKMYPLFVSIITSCISYWQQKALLHNGTQDDKDGGKLYNPWYGPDIITPSNNTGICTTQLQFLCVAYWEFIKDMYQQFYNSLQGWSHDYGDGTYYTVPVSKAVFGGAFIPDMQDQTYWEHSSGGIAPLSEDYIKQKAIDDNAARSRGETTTPIDWWVLYNLKYHASDKQQYPLYENPYTKTYWSPYVWGNSQYHWWNSWWTDAQIEIIRTEYMFAFDEYYDNALNLLRMLKKLSGIKWLAGEEGWDYQHPNNPGTNSHIEYDYDTLGYPFGVDKLSVKQALDKKDDANDTLDLLLSGGLYQSPVIPVAISSILCRNADTYGFIGDVYMNGSFNATVFNNGKTKTDTDTKDSQGNVIYIDIDNSGIIDTKFYSGNMTTPIGYDSALSVLKLGKSPGTRTYLGGNNVIKSGIIEPDSRAAFCLNNNTRDTTFLVDNFYDKNKPFINFNCKCIFTRQKQDGNGTLTPDGNLWGLGYYDDDNTPAGFIQTPDETIYGESGIYCPRTDASSFTSVPNVYDITNVIKSIIKYKLINMYPNREYYDDSFYKKVINDNVEFLFRNENSILLGTDNFKLPSSTDKSIDTFIKPSAVYRTTIGTYEPSNERYEITISGSLTNFRRYSLLVFEYDYSHNINHNSEYRDVAVIFRGYRTNEKNWFPVNDIRCNYVRNEGDKFYYDFKDVYKFFNKTLTSGDKIEININRPITFVGDTPTGILINDGSNGSLPILDARFLNDCYNFPSTKEYYQFGICVEQLNNYLDPLPPLFKVYLIFDVGTNLSFRGYVNWTPDSSWVQAYGEGDNGGILCQLYGTSPDEVYYYFHITDAFNFATKGTYNTTDTYLLEYKGAEGNVKLSDISIFPAGNNSPVPNITAAYMDNTGYYRFGDKNNTWNQYQICIEIDGFKILAPPLFKVYLIFDVGTNLSFRGYVNWTPDSSWVQAYGEGDNGGILCQLYGTSPDEVYYYFHITDAFNFATKGTYNTTDTYLLEYKGAEGNVKLSDISIFPAGNNSPVPNITAAYMDNTGYYRFGDKNNTWNQYQICIEIDGFN